MAPLEVNKEANNDNPKQVIDTKNDETERNGNDKSFSSKLRFICSQIRQMKIEVIMFIYMFSYIMRSVSSTTMIMDKVCLVHLSLPPAICSNLSGNPEIKNQVVKLANNYQLGHSLITMLPSSLLAVFIGSWSDKYGRKIPIAVALIGIIIDGLGSTVCAAFLYSRVEFYYIPALFAGFSGGFIGVLTVLFSYTADISTFKNRTMKFALLEVAFGTAMPLGSLTGGWLFKFFGYVPVFLLSTIGHILGLFWVILVLKETRGLDNKDSWKTKLRSLWSTKSVIESFRATIKPRPNKGRKQILLLILVMSIAVLTYASTPGINFLYVHQRYNWDNTTYSTVSAVFSVVGTLTMLISVPIFKKLKFGDPTLGIVGSVSLMCKNVGIGLASSELFYFIANFTGLLTGLVTLSGRARISKVSSKNDIGKIFSFLSSAESLVPILSQAVVSQVFNASLEVFPGLVYIVLGSFIIVPFGVFIWMSRLPAAAYYEGEDNTPPKDADNENDIQMSDNMGETTHI
ncbi:proton-coupled folate transporter-like [Uloborus diversus]|uniref:proton-coupled folate transporter-like n=1 Tax=Uloborus diversus TaxID=327109 RepID=UPI00240A1F06|nr:proton-coupled folate transporter-like [Uloborus diversus]